MERPVVGRQVTIGRKMHNVDMNHYYYLDRMDEAGLFCHWFSIPLFIVHWPCLRLRDCPRPQTAPIPIMPNLTRVCHVGVDCCSCRRPCEAIGIHKTGQYVDEQYEVVVTS